MVWLGYGRDGRKRKRSTTTVLPGPKGGWMDTIPRVVRGYLDVNLNVQCDRDRDRDQEEEDEDDCRRQSSSSSSSYIHGGGGGRGPPFLS